MSLGSCRTGFVSCDVAAVLLLLGFVQQDLVPLGQHQLGQMSPLLVLLLDPLGLLGGVGGALEQAGLLIYVGVAGGMVLGGKL